MIRRTRRSLALSASLPIRHPANLFGGTKTPFGEAASVRSSKAVPDALVVNWVLPLVISSLIACAGLAIAWVEHQARVRSANERLEAQGSNLVVESHSCQSSVTVEALEMRGADGRPVEVWIPTLRYRADLSIINRSERPNTIVSVELRISGIDPLPDWVLTQPSSPATLVGSQGGYGDLLCPPIPIAAGVSALKGEVAFDAKLLPEVNKEWAEMGGREFTLVLTDGYGQTFRTGAGVWRTA